jgi:hypothetical protein
VLRGTGAVAGVALRLWLREVARLFGVPVGRVVAGAIGAGVLALVLGGMLALVATQELDARLPVELAGPILGSSFGGATLTGGGIAVALCAASPPRTALQNLLDLLPVSRASARIGQLLPVVLMGFGFSLALSSTGVFVVAKLSSDTAAFAVGLTALLLLLASALLITVALYSLLETLAQRARLPAPYATAIAGAITFGLVAAATVPDLLLPHPPASAGDPPELLPHRAFASAVAAPSLGGWLLACGWVLLAAALTLLAAGTHRAAATPRRYVIPRGTRPLHRSAWWGHLWLETLVAIRSPQLVVVALAIPLAITGVAVVARQPLAEPFVPSLASGIAALPSLVALSSVGRTMPFRWMSALLTAHPGGWVAPKAVGAVALAVPMATPALGALLVLGLLDPDAVAGVVSRAALLLALALACGTFVPVSEQQPLSATIAALLLATLYLLGTLTLAAAESALGSASGTPLAVAATAIALGVYAAATARQGAQNGAL